MDRAIYFMLRAIFCELQAARPELGLAERSALQAEAEASSDAAGLAYSVLHISINDLKFRTAEPPPASG